jgi:hypothetical protein
MATTTSQRTEPSGSVTTQRTNAYHLTSYPNTQDRTATHLATASPPAPLDSTAETPNANTENTHGPTGKGNQPMVNTTTKRTTPPRSVTEPRSKASQLVGHPTARGRTATYLPEANPVAPPDPVADTSQHPNIKIHRRTTGKDNGLMAHTAGKRTEPSGPVTEPRPNAFRLTSHPPHGSAPPPTSQQTIPPVANLANERTTPSRPLPPNGKPMPYRLVDHPIAQHPGAANPETNPPVSPDSIAKAPTPIVIRLKREMP